MFLKGIASAVSAEEYVRLLSEARLRLGYEHVDEGENHYYAFIKQ